jgi:hypothetical protein
VDNPSVIGDSQQNTDPRQSVPAVYPASIQELAEILVGDRRVHLPQCHQPAKANHVRLLVTQHDRDRVHPITTTHRRHRRVGDQVIPQPTNHLHRRVPLGNESIVDHLTNLPLHKFVASPAMRAPLIDGLGAKTRGLGSISARWHAQPFAGEVVSGLVHSCYLIGWRLDAPVVVENDMTHLMRDDVVTLPEGERP